MRWSLTGGGHLHRRSGQLRGGGQIGYTIHAVRDTKDRVGGPVLHLDAAVWSAFTDRLKG